MTELIANWCVAPTGTRAFAAVRKVILSRFCCYHRRRTETANLSGWKPHPFRLAYGTSGTRALPEPIPAHHTRVLLLGGLAFLRQRWRVAPGF
jgi:hypothetical protein